MRYLAMPYNTYAAVVQAPKDVFVNFLNNMILPLCRGEQNYKYGRTYPSGELKIWTQKLQTIPTIQPLFEALLS
jgi:hypothetical protein